MKRIAVIGTGYVGLVTGVCFADLGNKVVCVDIDEEKIRKLRAGQIPLFEPGLEEICHRGVQEGRLHFTLDLAEGVADAEVIFLALPTPPGADGSADLRFICEVADQLGPLLKQYTAIVDKSTVPVGTSKEVYRRIAAHTAVPFDVVSNPEFLREGRAIQDFMQPDRIIIGSSSPKAREIMAELYQPVTHDRPLFFMSERSAELTKYAANSFLATKITFMNQIAGLCEAVDADVDDVRMGLGSDPRIGAQFLYPGIGYGGSCFPKDVLALIHTSEEHGHDFALLKTVIDNNKAQAEVLAHKVLRYFKNNVQGKTFGVWGLAFKPQTDDIREAPALTIMKALKEAGAMLRVYDPEAMPNTQKLLGKDTQVVFAKDELDAVKSTDALLIATEWQQFAAVPLDKVKRLMKQPVIFDGRNMFELDTMRGSGFYYESIGRAPVTNDAT